MLKKKQFDIKNYKEILPGLFISVLVGYISIFISILIPKVGAASISIFLGMFVGNLFLNQKVFQKVINFQRQICYHIQ